MGGWFRKEIKTVDDLKGLKMRIGGFAGRGDARSSASCRSRSPAATSIRRWRRARIDAAEWVGPYDDEKLGFYKVAQVLLLSRLVGRRRDAAHLHQPREVERAAEDLPGDPRRRVPGANTWMLANYDAHNPAALKRLVAGGAQLRPFSQGVLEACFKAANEVYAEITAKNADFKKIYETMALPRRRLSVVPGRRVHLRHLHDPRPRPRR